MDTPRQSLLLQEEPCDDLSDILNDNSDAIANGELPALNQVSNFIFYSFSY